MELLLVSVGKVRDQNLREICEEYQQRISRYASLRIVEIKDSNTASEGKLILEKVKGYYVIVFTPEGRSMSSEKFAQLLKNNLKAVAFVIGSPHGLSDDVVQSASMLCSLSMFTLPHELCRVVVLEQIYRACTILKGHPYHK